MSNGTIIKGKFGELPNEPFKLPYEDRIAVIPEGNNIDNLNPYKMYMLGAISSRAALLETHSLSDTDGSTSSAVLTELGGRVSRIYLKTEELGILSAQQAERLREGYEVPGLDPVEDSTWITVVWQDSMRRYLHNVRATRSVKTNVRRNYAYDASKSFSENTIALSHIHNTVNAVLSRQDSIGSKNLELH